MDKKPVYIISNAHLSNTTMVQRGNPDGSKSDVSCPMLVSEYNRHMDEVDLLDQHKCYYSYNRKSKRWWLHLFFHMFDLCIVNAYILYKHPYRMNFHPPMKFKPKDQLKYRMELIDQLVNHYTCRRVTGSVVRPVVSMVPTGHKIADLRQMESHLSRTM